jgi:hypothetical protein
VRIELPFPEAVALATARQPLPPMITSLDCAGGTVLIDADLRGLPSDSLAVRLALAAAGTLSLTARFTGFAAGVATFAVRAHARGFPAHKLVPYLLGTVNAAIERAGVPAGVVQVTEGEEEPLVRIDLQRAIETAVLGVRVTSFDLRDAGIFVDAQVGVVRRTDEPVETAPAEPAGPLPEEQAEG